MAIHVTSGRIYRVIGHARDVRNIDQIIVVYAQTDWTTLREQPQTPLPPGTLWTRPLSEFHLKFREYTIRK
jgi:hypothetical protein